jgi:hypothetical protein
MRRSAPPRPVGQATPSIPLQMVLPIITNKTGFAKRQPVLFSRIWEMIKKVSPTANIANIVDLPGVMLKAMQNPALQDLLFTVIQEEQGLSIQKEEMYKPGSQGLSYYFETLGEGGHPISAGAYQRVFSSKPKREDLPTISETEIMSKIETIMRNPKMSKDQKNQEFMKLYSFLQKQTSGMSKMGFK